jgi:hypothetical protein
VLLRPYRWEGKDKICGQVLLDPGIKRGDLHFIDHWHVAVRTLDLALNMLDGKMKAT